ncbi:MAG: extracellular solute-binding protein [Alphaproteobacteria bacterium]|nr:extracellular solute-binding protein [Alphaproteobacteria bacterium]MCD8526363.1 extracellular solute-binding protein [Alphaproteobacteria bacterium]MCD8570216.1 extracellular solute-binding protein [Alphaproteobacteria bacterium]
MRHILLTLLSLVLIPSFALAQEEAPAAEAPATSVTPKHGIALHGDPKYPADFKNVEYVNPNAPKGGTLKQAAIGSFDSLNPFIVKGTPAAGLAENFIRSGLVYESLMMNSWDEPFSLYGVIAESIEVPEDRSWVAFNLRPEAKWADGKPITADDVVWTFNTLHDKGQPFFKAYYGDVKSVTAESPSRVKYEFAVKGNAELPLIIAEMAILPKHFWEGKTFDQTTLEPPLGSGPYKVGKVDPGRSIEYVRRDDWWGKDLPFFKGFYNFDTLRYDYFLDDNVALESFLGDDYDVRSENTAKLWENAYDVPAVKDGRLIKAEIENSRPAGMQGFVYNIRRPVFADPKVREALAYAFDFEWSNKQFAYGAYTRTDSHFENSELASSGLPSAAELAILEPFRGKIPDEVFTKTYAPPVNDGTGNNRANLRTATQMLDEAGWKIGADGIREKDGVKLKFEIIDANPQFEKWVLPFIQNLKRIGVEASFRVVDAAQYQNRMNGFDFDMTIGAFGQSDSPGNEQRDFWSTAKADMQGSRNIIGIKDPVIDDIIEQIIQAKSREDLVTKTRALDRILLWRHYVIPMWHYPKWRIAYWNTIERPEKLSGISPLISYTWWAKPKAE